MDLLQPPHGLDFHSSSCKTPTPGDQNNTMLEHMVLFEKVKTQAHTGNTVKEKVCCKFVDYIKTNSHTFFKIS